MEKFENFIAGEFTAAKSGEWLPVYEPATGEQYAEIPDSGEADIAAAVAAARGVFSAWAALPAIERGRIMERIAQGIETHLDELVALESRDQGK
ncbi:MAG: aldehyde dehydrogenase family protein, partial [Gammaproteobacteria bacterium]